MNKQALDLVRMTQHNVVCFLRIYILFILDSRNPTGILVLETYSKITKSLNKKSSIRIG